MELSPKIKAALFDMDGVLIDARDWHFEALNEALAPFGFQISYDDHLARFNGLSTNSKLKILSSEYGFPLALHDVVNTIKQDRTLRIAGKLCFPVVQHQILLSRLYQKKILVGVVTNSIRKSAEAMLKYADLMRFLETLVTNQDVENPKPNPECYVLACKSIGVHPSQVLVVEDGDYGAQSATLAGCQVIRVDSPINVSIDLLLPYIPELLDEIS